MKQITIYSPLGIPITDIKATVFCAWQIAGMAEARFEIATSDPKCTEDNLRFGNIIRIQHDSLPDWVGFIDFPREWGDGKVTVHAISAEVLMDWRLLLPYKLEGVSAAGLARHVITQCNIWGGLPIYEGELLETAQKVSYTVGGKAIDILNDMGIEWNVTANEVNGVLRLYLNTHRWMGEVTRFVLDDKNSKNISPKLTENGPIYNQMFLVGAVDSENARNFIEVRDETSISRYGLRQAIIEIEGLEISELQATAEGKLSLFKDVSYTATPTVLNEGDAYKYMRLGNFVGWTTPTAYFTQTGGNGIEMQMRIVGMEWDELTDQVGLITESYQPFSPRGMFASDIMVKKGIFRG